MCFDFFRENDRMPEDATMVEGYFEKSQCVKIVITFS